MAFGQARRELSPNQYLTPCSNSAYSYGLDFWGDAKGLGQTNLNLSVDLIGDVYQSGALFSYAGEPEEITIRVGISFVSEEQACQNAETEVGDATFEEIEAASKALWNERLSTITIDFANTEPNITELLYSSWYRSNLTPVSNGDMKYRASADMVNIEQCYARDTRAICQHDAFLLRLLVLQVRHALSYRLTLLNSTCAAGTPSARSTPSWPCTLLSISHR